VVIGLEIKNVFSFVGLGVGPYMTRGGFLCKEGEQQGVVESMPLFTLGIDAANNLTNNELQPFGGALEASANDRYIIRPPHIVFACLHRHREPFA